VVKKLVYDKNKGLHLNFSSQESILQNFFSSFFFFRVKLGHFTINIFILYVTKMQADQQKMEKFFVSKEKKLVGSIPAGKGQR